jgi:hypothetical protein
MTRLVVIESPYKGDTERNVAYARACVRDSLLRGEYPLASHLLYTQLGILRDDVAQDRALGIDAGLAWAKHADLTAAYVDFGISSGMAHGIRDAKRAGRPVEYRRLGQAWDRKAAK